MAARILVHGGAGGDSPDLRAGCVLAARRGRRALEAGAGALDAAVSAVVVLEDDSRFNAGAGSNLRLDGTIETDAALMDDAGRFGGVCALMGIRNPVLAARRVMDTPHLMVSGEGARSLALRAGLAEADLSTARTQKKLAKVRRMLREADLEGSCWEGRDLGSVWNYDADLRTTLGGGDTVGAVVRDREGHFAVAGSTGGTPMALRGRVGDTPVLGAGLYAGPAGAVAATGNGEEILRALLCYRVYARMERGCSAREACEWGVELVPEPVVVGLIAMDAEGDGAAARGGMSIAGEAVG